MHVCVYEYALLFALVLNEMSKKRHVIPGMIMRGAPATRISSRKVRFLRVHDPGVDVYYIDF